MLIKYTRDSKSQTLRMRFPFQSTGRPISHRNVFRVYMIPLRDFVPEWNSRPGTTTGVNSRRGNSSWHDILWRYHVNKCRTMGGNRSKLASARKSPRCHVNTPLENRHNLGENIPLGQSRHMIVCNTAFLVSSRNAPPHKRCCATTLKTAVDYVRDEWFPFFLKKIISLDQGHFKLALLRATRGARNTNLQVVITHA